MLNTVRSFLRKALDEASILDLVRYHSSLNSNYIEFIKLPDYDGELFVCRVMFEGKFSEWSIQYKTNIVKNWAKYLI